MFFPSKYRFHGYMYVEVSQMTSYAKACLEQKASNRSKMYLSASVLQYLTFHPLRYACATLNKRTAHAEIARWTYEEAEWYNTLGHVLLLVMTQLYSTCFSQDHSTQFLRYKGHSCHIPPQCRFCHSPQLSQHPIWQCWQVQSWTIGQFQAHKLHRCLDGVSRPSHLGSKKQNLKEF